MRNVLFQRTFFFLLRNIYNLFFIFLTRKPSALRAYVSLSPSETEFKHGIQEVVAGFENTIGMHEYCCFSLHKVSNRCRN